MLGYLTIGDPPSGIYSTQVIDTCEFLSELSGNRVKLISLISIRRFWKNRRKIKKEYSNSIVIPMAPKLENWRLNLITLQVLFTFLKGYSLICRNSIPTVLAIKLREKGLLKKVIYDGRGCEYEQIIEYNVISNSTLAQEILENEKHAVIKSDMQISVSEALVKYWKKNFDYFNSEPLVIPCTFPNKQHEVVKFTKSREQFGIEEDDIVFAYSGTVSGWQSFDKMFKFLENHLNYYPSLKVLLLTQKTKEVDKLIKSFPSRVIHKWVRPQEVQKYLRLADYGVLIREKSVTNWVASPIKFADYLSAGLRVIVNEGSIHQVISFIEKHKVGHIYNGELIELLNPLKASQKNEIMNLANDFYLKSSEVNLEGYKKLLAIC